MSLAYRWMWTAPTAATIRCMRHPMFSCGRALSTFRHPRRGRHCHPAFRRVRSGPRSERLPRRRWITSCLCSATIDQTPDRPLPVCVGLDGTGIKTIILWRRSDCILRYRRGASNIRGARLVQINGSGFELPHDNHRCCPRGSLGRSAHPKSAKFCAARLCRVFAQAGVGRFGSSTAEKMARPCPRADCWPEVCRIPWTPLMKRLTGAMNRPPARLPSSTGWLPARAILGSMGRRWLSDAHDRSRM